MPSLVVNSEGIELFYYDTGVPAVSEPGKPYKTLFVVHGMGYNGLIYKKVQALGLASGMRIVAINRRGYSGSTPLSPAELAVSATGGTEDAKEAFITARGLEMANFIDRFVQQQNIPPITEDGKGGGMGLLGWSSAVPVVLSAVANLDKLPTDVQERLARYLRALILEEPPSMAVGQPPAEGSWSVYVDPTIPEKDKNQLHTLWVSAYFTHGDLAARDPALLSHCAPSLHRRPSIFGFSADDKVKIVEATFMEGPLLYHALPQQRDVYRKACFDRAVRARLPHMKVWAMVGDSSGSFAIGAWWSMQDDDKDNGGGLIQFKVTPGVNHMIQWDDPDKAVANYLEAMA
ncbi:Alpha/Beta hydrolase protein [Sparassis latifolia]